MQIAIVYDHNHITIYRDGKVYAKYDTAAQQTFGKTRLCCSASGARIGPGYLHRFSPTLAGTIEEVRLYDVALSPAMVAALKPNRPSPIEPLGQWTFEDGTLRDSMGHFPQGELCGKARIADGKLIIDGADSYGFVPAATKYDKAEPSVEEGDAGSADRKYTEKIKPLLIDGNYEGWVNDQPRLHVKKETAMNYP